ncbi:MAG: O-antigen ligase family protein [Patescibacteria group bacterium]
MINLHQAYLRSEGQSNFIFFVSTATLVFAVLGIVFLSPMTVFAILVGTLVVIMTIVRPLWSLALLAFLLPFEPFLLKWTPDEIFLYARLFSEVLIYFLFAVTVVRAVMRGEKLMSTPIGFPFFLFLITLVASSVINFVDPFVVAVGVRQLIRFILVFFIVVLLKPSRGYIRKLTVALFVLVSLQATLGIGQAIIGEPLDALLLPSEVRSYGEFTLQQGAVQFWDSGSRVFGTLGRYDRLGTFIAFFLLIGVGFLYEKGIRLHRRELWFLFALGLPALVLTFSRSSWFGFLLGFLFLALFVKRDKRVLWGSLIATAVLGMYLAYSGIVVSRLIDVPDQPLAERFFEAFSYERWRGEYYGLGRLFWIVQTVTTVLPASPLLGWGPGQYGGGVALLFHNTRVYDELQLPYGVYGTEGYIDNNWFSILGETGLIGFSFFLWMYIGLFLYAIKVGRRSDDPFVRAISFGFAGAMIAVALNSFLATFFEVRSLAVYLWMYGGFVVVLGIETDRKKLIDATDVLV